ncbi:MAG TPA: PPC domain-containing DNA-binding protein [Stellaceae bacterium]|nr:PPC domain-containing DNA-binding protein [Stellaceae bacterium]
MHTKLLNADPPVTYAVVLDTGDEVAGELGRFVRENKVEAASITAIGGFRDAVLGYFDWSTKQYKKIPVDEQVEVLSLLGDVAVADEGPSLHLHAVLGKVDGSVVGGHLLEAHVRPTLEVILIQPPSYLRKRRDPVTGLPLLALAER